MAFDYGTPLITTSQATCTGAADVLVAARPQRRSVLLKNINGGADAYVGASGVTTSTGFIVPQGESVEIETTAAVYGATASGTATFHIIETYR